MSVFWHCLVLDEVTHIRITHVYKITKISTKILYHYPNLYYDLPPCQYVTKVNSKYSLIKRG